MVVKTYTFDAKALGDILKSYYKDTAHITLNEVVFNVKEYCNPMGVFLEAFGKGEDDLGKANVPFQISISSSTIKEAVSHYVDPEWRLSDYAVQTERDWTLKKKFGSLIVHATAKEKQKVK